MNYLKVWFFLLVFKKKALFINHYPLKMFRLNQINADNKKGYKGHDNNPTRNYITM